MPPSLSRLKKGHQQYPWTGASIALASLITYTVLFFKLAQSDTDHKHLELELYTLSIDFLLIMVLLIAVISRKRHTSEKNLQKTEEKYVDLVEQAADSVVVLNIHGIIVSTNAAVEWMSGYTPEELIGRHFLKTNVLSGPSVGIAAKEFIQLLSGAKRPPFELSMLRKDKTSFIVEAHARRIKNALENTVIHVIMRDVTDRKKSEENLRQEKNRAQNYLNIAGVMIMTLDREGRVTLINKKGCEILGYPEEEIIGQNWFEKFLLLEDSMPLKNEESFVMTKSGEKRVIAWSNTAILDNENNAVGTLISGQDVTEKQAIENQLMLQSAALEAAANAIVITDKSGKIVWANQALTKISGYTQQEVVGQNPRIFKSGLHNDYFYENMWNTVLAGNIWHDEIFNRRKDDRLYTEEMTITPVRNRQGDIQHFIAIKHDITERKRLQQNLLQANIELEANSHKLERTLLEMAAKNKQLQEAQNQLIQSEKLAAIGILSSGIAHEIKNPLAIISLSIEEFEDHSEKLDDQSKNYIGMIKRAAERANNVIIELLRFARVSDLKVESINLYHLLEGTFLLVKNIAKFKGITIQQITNDQTIEISGDRILLEQVFFNLLMNAIDSTPRGGRITVTSRLRKAFSNAVDQDEIVIDVEDTGHGIAPEILSKIFEPFFTTKEQGKGTGLGLSTVYTLLKRHRGTIEVQSLVGKGTTFTIVLPPAPKKPPEEKGEHHG